MVTAGLTAAAISAAAQSEADKQTSGRAATTDHYVPVVGRPTDNLLMTGSGNGRPPIAPRPSLGRLDSGKDELSQRQPETMNGSGRQLPQVGGLDILDNS